MTNLLRMLAAALAAQAGAAPAADGFPCEKLGDATVEVHDRLDEAAAPGRGAVEVRRKAVLFESRQALSAPNFAIGDPYQAGLSGPAAPPAMFRHYRSGSETHLCTQTRNEALFGAGDGRTQYMLRCLIDRDGDGAYESFVHKLELVPYNMRTGRASAPSGAAPRVLPLAQPVRLVPVTAPPRPDPFSRAEILTRISVGRVSGNTIELRFSGGVRRGPAALADRMMDGAETIVSVPMTEGAEVPVLGTRIRFAKRAGKWTAAVLGGFGRPPRLLCSGAVVEAGDTFTILTPGGQSTFARANIRP